MGGEGATLHWDATKAACPTHQVLTRVGDKWTMLLVSVLESDGTLRFSKLRERVEGITQKVLTQCLRALERDGIVERRVHATAPVTVEYTLTPLGHSLALAVATIRTWSYEHIHDIERARTRYDRRGEPAQA